jgi:hypothetical protein
LGNLRRLVFERSRERVRGREIAEEFRPGGRITKPFCSGGVTFAMVAKHDGDYFAPRP